MDQLIRGERMGAGEAKSSYIVVGDGFEYDPETVKYLASNLNDPYVYVVFREVVRFRTYGLMKSYLADYPNKRRRYDNAFLVLEACKFIEKAEEWNAHKYYLTVRGTQLLDYLLNDLGIDQLQFRTVSPAEFQLAMQKAYQPEPEMPHIITTKEAEE